MNKYLTKLAEGLPYRDRVEVIIQKGEEILLTKSKNKETGEPYYGFPGGGVDDQTETKAAENECLEEVGVAIKNLKSLKGTFKEEGGLGKKDDRHLKFKGSITKWYIADYDKIDRSKLGDDNDSRKYIWVTLPEAIKLIKNDRAISSFRSDVLKTLKSSD